MQEMSTLCCTYRIIMCVKPHSADVERIISANNFLKSVGTTIVVYIEIE